MQEEKNILNNLSDVDKLTLLSIAGDLVGLGTSFIPGAGGVISTISGIGATSSQLAADIKRDGLDIGDLGSAALGFGLDLAAFIPFAGVFAKTAKTHKTLAKVAPYIVKTFGVAMGSLGLASSVSALKKLASEGSSSMTMDDWRDATNGILGLSGILRSPKRTVSKTLPNRLSNNGRYTLATSADSKLNIPAFSNDIKVTPVIKQWADGKGQNLALEVRLNKRKIKDQIFEIVTVTDKNGNPTGEYDLHFKTDLGVLSNEEKNKLTQAVIDILPEGARIKTSGNISQGTINMFLNRLQQNGLIPTDYKFAVGLKDNEINFEKLQDLISNGQLAVNLNPSSQKINLPILLKAPNYTGKQYNYLSILDSNGNLDEEKFKNVIKRVERNFDVPSLNQIFSSNSRHNGRSILEHSILVANTAANAPKPVEFSKNEGVAAAAIHDIGKLFTLDKHHELLSSLLAQQVFKDFSPEALHAIRYHGKNNPITDFQRFLHMADLGNGEISISKIKELYPNSKIRYKSFDRIEKEYNVSIAATARKLGLTPLIPFRDAKLMIAENPDGSYKIITNNNGDFLIEYKGKQLTFKELIDTTKKEAEKLGIFKSKNLEQFKQFSLPLYEAEGLLPKKAMQILTSTEGEKLRSDADNGNIEAQHVLENVQKAITMSFPGLQILGSKSSKMSKDALEFNRMSAGQLSIIVDEYNNGYRGILAPILKGGENDLRRLNAYKPNENFGGYLYGSNSPLVALRFADVRKHYTSPQFQQYLNTIPQPLRSQIKLKIQEILDFTKAINIKQGNWQKLTNSKKKNAFRQGTFEDFTIHTYESQRNELLLLQQKYEELQNLIGDKYLPIGGVRRGIVKISPNVNLADYKNNNYTGRLPNDNPLSEFLPRSYGDHNWLMNMLKYWGIQQAITANIGETYPKALKRGAPYGGDFMFQPQDFIMSKYQIGGQLNYLNYFK